MVRFCPLVLKWRSAVVEIVLVIDEATFAGMIESTQKEIGLFAEIQNQNPVVVPLPFWVPLHLEKCRAVEKILADSWDKSSWPMSPMVWTFPKLE